MRQIKAKQDEHKVGIEQLRVTRKQGKKKEREVLPTSGVLRQEEEEEEDGPPPEKNQIRALMKKLKAIDVLMEREADGEELDEQQRVKVASLGPTLSRLSELTGEDLTPAVDGGEEQEQEGVEEGEEDVPLVADSKRQKRKQKR